MMKKGKHAKYMPKSENECIEIVGLFKIKW